MIISAAVLCDARARAGLTCPESATLIYTPVSTWYAWESGQAHIPAPLFALYLHKSGIKPITLGSRGEAEYKTYSPNAAHIKAMRKKSGLSQVQAAALVRVTPLTWLRWEKERANMHPAVFELFLLKAGWNPVKRLTSRGRETDEERFERMREERNRDLARRKVRTKPQAQPDEDVGRILAAWGDAEMAETIARSKRDAELYYMAANAPGGFDVSELDRVI